ncbi:Holliday junction resolvase RecU [Mycoplasmopsis bovirhinis]|uniref:Holliday junction resolvase RecU n=1 Tax=Mycoplasmopsis bovirhinis TaxID=29553 RepID=UPI000E7191E4|nr:Holliday junction resolvase RecU [Mycoplasmopsis bovirhinis]
MIKNRGMFLEKIINQTINYYWENNYAFINKKNLDISLKKIASKDKKIIVDQGIISKKSTVDYIGMYQGRFVCFEAKSCNEDRFDLNNLKPHQLNYLKLIKLHGGLAFVILFFSNHNLFLKVDIEYLCELLEKKQKSIKMQEIKRNSKILNLEFPGILNIF